jgi:hypothetical protein
MSEETIFREVDEELRRDSMHSAWRRFGPYVIGAAVLIVLLVAANEGWSWWQNSNASRSSDQFYAALDLEDGGDVAGAQKALDKVIAEGSGNYPLLAKFKQAGLLAKQGKKPEALAAYDALATSQGNPRLRELSLLLAANTIVDKGDVAAVKSRVEGLLAPEDALRNSARETIGLTQYKANDLNGARDSFEAVIADPLASSELRARMQLYVAQLVAQGATPPATAGDVKANNAADAAAAAISAIGAATAPAQPSTAPAANDNSATAPAPAATPAAAAAPAADATTPAGVESNQQTAPDPLLDLASPPPAAPAAGNSTPALSNGASVPAPATSLPAPATGTSTGQ